MPGHRRSTVTMARQAQVLSRFLANLSVRIVTGRAVESVRTTDLVRAGDLLELSHVAVALIADARRFGTHRVGRVPRRTDHRA